MKKMIKYFIISVYKIFVKISFFYGAAIILSILTKPMSKKKIYRILALNKSVFIDDLKAINSINSDFQILLFPRLLLSEFVKKNVSNFDELNDSSYHKILNDSDEQKKIYDSMKNIFIYLKKILQIDVILAGNYVYVSQQEFFRAAKYFKVPIVVLYKEGMFLENISSSISKKLYSGKIFLGDKILFYNKPIKEKLINSKIKGINSSTSEVVGVPRLDSFINKKSDRVENKFVLFAFDPMIKSDNLIDNKKYKKDFIKRCVDFQRSIFEFCKKNNIDLIIKIKKPPNEKKSILSILGLKEFSLLPKNIKITVSGNSLDYIDKSKYVAGYASTTLLEAIILDKYIFSPLFEDILDNPNLTYLDKIKNSINYIKNDKDIEKIIIKNKSYKKVSGKLRNDTLEKMLYRLDGRASQRVIDIISKMINNNH